MQDGVGGWGLVVRWWLVGGVVVGAAVVGGWCWVGGWPLAGCAAR